MRIIRPRSVDAFAGFFLTIAKMLTFVHTFHLTNAS